MYHPNVPTVEEKFKYMGIYNFGQPVEQVELNVIAAICDFIENWNIGKLVPATRLTEEWICCKIHSRIMENGKNDDWYYDFSESTQNDAERLYTELFVDTTSVTKE